jgi:hypothetical protein
MTGMATTGSGPPGQALVLTGRVSATLVILRFQLPPGRTRPVLLGGPIGDHQGGA